MKFLILLILQMLERNYEPSFFRSFIHRNDFFQTSKKLFKNTFLKRFQQIIPTSMRILTGHFHTYGNLTNGELLILNGGSHEKSY